MGALAIRGPVVAFLVVGFVWTSPASQPCMNTECVMIQFSSLGRFDERRVRYDSVRNDSTELHAYIQSIRSVISVVRIGTL